MNLSPSDAECISDDWWWNMGIYISAKWSRGVLRIYPCCTATLLKQSVEWERFWGYFFRATEHGSVRNSWFTNWTWWIFPIFLAKCKRLPVQRGRSSYVDPAASDHGIHCLLQIIPSPIPSGGYGKTMGKPWENHGKTMGKPWENHGKMVIHM